MANYIIQFPLVTQPFQEDILNRRLEIGRNIYNALARKTLSRYREMKKKTKKIL